MLSWFGSKRNAPFDDAWTETLQRNVWHYRLMDQEQRDRVHAVVGRMVASKHWEGGAKLRVTDEMRVTISGVAALLTLGLEEPFFFDRLKTIIVYAKGYRQPRRSNKTILATDHDPLFGSAPEARLGEAWQWGPVVLSWRHTLQSASSRGEGDNLVLHEFAHHLDGLDGTMDGAPAMPSRQQQRKWYAVTDAEYYRLVGQARRNEVTLLDHYGATNRAEFFAIATECFFERPHEMKQSLAELYHVLSALYHQDPADWIARTSHSESIADPPSQAPLRIDLRGLGLKGTDAAFARGVELMNHEQFESAVDAFSQVLRSESEDSEAFAMRADCLMELGDTRNALADALKAIQIDPAEQTARLVAADALLELEDAQAAEPHVRYVLREDRKNALAWLLMGEIELMRNRIRAAIQACRESLLIDSTNPRTHRLMAESCEALGRMAEAEKHWRRAHELDPQGN